MDYFSTQRIEIHANAFNLSITKEITKKSIIISFANEDITCTPNIETENNI